MPRPQVERCGALSYLAGSGVLVAKTRLHCHNAEEFLSKKLAQFPDFLDGVLRFDFDKGRAYRRPRNASGWERADRPMYPRKPEHYWIVYFSDQDHSFAILAHRLLFFMKNFKESGCLDWPEQINHKNHDPSDNSASNLEESDPRHNQERRKKHLEPGRHPGVTRHKKSGLLQVVRGRLGLQFDGGLFEDTLEGKALACKVSDELADYLHSFKDKQSLPPYKQAREEVFKRLRLSYQHGSPYQTGKPTP